MKQAFDKFQNLLRDLFQFDCADLDFGIYRIMNYKRDVVEQFITQDLPKTIADELDRDVPADQSLAAKGLQEVAGQINQTLGKDALDADGNLAKTYHATPLGRKYRDLKAKAAGGRGREALEASIFNHLYAFFSRYYQDGDFISKRRYSRRQKYAIPYNGEEVYLYWANNDQYYVKTAEQFHDYAFTSRGITVHFKIASAIVEQNNVKGDKRFFLLLAKKINWDEKAGRLIIPFEYRPLTEQEEIRYGKKNQQDTIIAGALEEIPKQLKKSDKALIALSAERRKNANGDGVSFLEHHLRQYTRRNTSDFFIHKDLKGFLSRELYFYPKNEVVNLDEMETAGEDRAEGWFQVMRVIKTVGNIAEDFYPEIAACERQWREWKELFRIDEEQSNLFNSGKSKKGKRIAFLQGHPTLVLDTKHFDAVFLDKLLASMGHLDGSTDGLLIHSENFQALNVLLENYHERIKCIYIDPPYNSKSSEILYKNTYKHSSWLSLMSSRIQASKALLNNENVYIVAIDENEQERLGLLLKHLFPEHMRTCVSVIHNKAGIQGDNFSYCHEYVYFVYPPTGKYIGRVNRADADIVPLRDWGGDESKRETTRNCFYPIYVKDKKILGFGDVCSEDFYPRSSLIERKDGILEIYPVDGEGVERKWRHARQSVDNIKDELTCDEVNGELVIRRNKSEYRFKTVWADKKNIANTHGSKLLTNILGEKIPNLYPKSLYTVQDSVDAVTQSSLRSLIVDYFAGSGTTGHAVINLNQQKDKKHRFILAEMGQYFDTILLPRIKKVTFSPEWKDGKPTRMARGEEAKRSPRIIKYIRLESYEDALNNLSFDDASGQAALKFDDYLLRYLLRWETRKVYYDDGRRYLVYRGRIDHREIAVIWRDTADWTKADLERDKKFVAGQ